MDSEKFYRAADIYSHRTRRGLLPLKSAQFYKLLSAGKFPEPDASIGNTRLWRGSTIEAFLTRQ